jgi:diguanylate cyclase (GGDEF)-like protein
MVIVMPLAEWRYWANEGPRVFGLVSVSMTIAVVILNFNPDINIIACILILPIFISLLFFSVKNMAFTVSLTFAAYTISYITNVEMRRYHDIYDYIGFISMLVGYSVISFGILKRGQELVAHLKQSVELNISLEQSADSLKKLVRRDTLTEIYNHLAYHEKMDQLITIIDTESALLQLAIIDIDNFKSFNDQYGHHTGDLVLREVAATINRFAGDQSFVARYGGEEFVVIWTGLENSTVKECAERIRMEVSKIVMPSPAERTISVSIGLRQYVLGEGKESLFNETDKLLYEAKHSGKNKVSTSL